ncbi:MAG TPA: carboxymuconolactone decarboxylase family protein [Candidatus Kapabacteria bacterium]|nr:carboxymuconolactone decarboxylase family protein [Candidatus Kapabacteria bacterium]HPO62928.1 carboxymuconolactone decarboxylase family protein [Candidatus Kapabacteria bacterium]
MGHIKEFHKRRTEGNNKVLELDFLPFKRFFALDTRCYEDGAIPSKYKELMGLSCSLVLRCNDCVIYHIERSIAEGASRDELNEAMNIALVIGGSIVIPHLRLACEVIDEILK